MNIYYDKFYSRNLGRDMEYKVYGDGGTPVLAIPCQGGRFYEFEDMKMLDVYAPYIERGDVQVFTIDSLDYETLACDGDCRARICRHESWIKYIVEEALPVFSHINCGDYGAKFIVTGISLGALHAVNLYFRFPERFTGVMGLSGIYSTDYHFGDYHDELTYANSPLQYLANMPHDHPYADMYRNGKIIICVGQGAWENETLRDTRAIAEVLKKLDVPAWVDIWGGDVKHDWEWWFVQAAYFLPKLIY